MASTAAESIAAAIRIFRPSAKIIPVVGPIVEGVLESVLELYKHVELVKANRKKAKELVERIGLIAYSMVKHSHLQTLSPKGRVEMQSHLRVLESIIAKTHPCIKLLQSRTILQRVARPTADDSELKDLNIALDRAIEQFHIGATVRTISKMFQDQRTDELEFLRKILRPVTAALYDSSTAPSACLEGTRTDVLDAMFDWTFSDSPQRVFWLSGMAGTGKSTIAKTICQRIAKHIGSLDFDDPDVHLVTFFITHNTTDRRSPFRMLHTLAFYVCCAIPSFRTFLHDALSSTPELIDKAMEVQMEKLLAQPLASSCSETQTKIILVIDAFDECDKIDGREGGDFLPTLLSVISQSDLSIRLIFTSRNEQSINNMFAPCREERTLRLHEIERGSVDNDIRAYLAHELDGGGSSPSQLDPAQLDSLVGAAGGLFVYAATVARYLKSMALFDRAVLITTILERATSSPAAMNSTPLPDYTLLDGMYGRILLEALPAGANEPNRRIAAEVVYSVVVSLALVKDKVSPQTLAALIGRDPRQVTTVLMSLVSVLTFESSTAPIRFLHASFYEFVLDPRRCAAQFPGVGVSHVAGHALHHATLTRGCLEILNSRLREDICGIGDPCFQKEIGSDSYSDLSERIVRCIPDELAYACFHWGAHFEASGARSSLPDALLEDINKELSLFCHSHLLHWIEAIALTSKYGNASRDVIQSVLLSEWWSSKEIISMPPTYAAMQEVYGIIRSEHVLDDRPLHIYTLAQIYGSSDSVQDQLPRTDLTHVQWLSRPQHLWSSFRLRDPEPAGDVEYVFALSQDGSHLVSMIRYFNVPFGSTSQVDLLHLESGNRFVLPAQPHTTQRDTCESLSWSCCTAISRSGTFIAYDVSGQQNSDLQLWIIVSKPYTSASCHVNGWISALTFSEDASCIYAVVLETRGHPLRLSCRKFSLQSGVLSEEAATVLHSFDDADEHWPTAAPDAPDPYCCEDWTRQACRHIARSSRLHESLCIKMTATSQGITVAIALMGRSDIRVWQLSSTCSCVVLRGDTKPVYDIELSPGGDNRQLLASFYESDDDGIILWDVQSGSRIAIFPLDAQRRQGAESLAFSYDGALFAVFGACTSTSESRPTFNVTLWDMSAPQTILGQYNLPVSTRTSCDPFRAKAAFLPPCGSSRESRLIVWDGEAEFWIYDWSHFSRISTAMLRKRFISAAVFSHDGHAFATVTPTGAGIDIWKTRDGGYLHSLDMYTVIGYQFQELRFFVVSVTADDSHIAIFAHCCVGGTYGFYKLDSRRQSSGGWSTDYQHVHGLEMDQPLDALSLSSSWDVLAHTARNLPGDRDCSDEVQVVTVRDLYEGGNSVGDLWNIVFEGKYYSTTTVQLSSDGQIVAVLMFLGDLAEEVRLWIVGQASDHPYRIVPIPALKLGLDSHGMPWRLGFSGDNIQIWCCNNEGSVVYDIKSSTKLTDDAHTLTTFRLCEGYRDWLTYTSPAHPKPRRVLCSVDTQKSPGFTWFDKTVVIGPCYGQFLVLRVDEDNLSRVSPIS